MWIFNLRMVFKPKKPNNIMSYFINFGLFKPEKKLNTIDVMIGLKPSQDKYDYQGYTIAIKNFYIDIIAEKDIPIVFEYYYSNDD